MRNMILAATSALVLTATAAQADLISYYHFNTGAASGTTLTTPYAADVGSGSVIFVGGAPENLVQFGGTTVNAVGDTPGGQDLAIQNGADGANNESSLTFELSTDNLEDIVLSFAARRSSTGFATIDVSTSPDGSTFTNVTSIDAVDVLSGSYTDVVVDLSAIELIEDQTSAFVRLGFSGGSTTSSSGNLRLDNVQFNGTVIPEPASMALLGLGGLVFLRRRRA